MIVAAIALLAVASQGFLAVQGGPIGGAGVNVNAICENQPFKNGITVDQVSLWAAQLDQDSNIDCPEHISDAIKDLDSVISETSSNACTEESADAITTFYEMYIEDVEEEEQIPEALQTFALTYAMRMSQRCKINMAQFLAGEASEQLSPEDFASVSQWILPGSDLDELVKSIAEPGEVLLPSDLAATLPNKEDMMSKIVGFKTEAGSDMMQLKAVCDKRFKPVYGPLVEPVAMLSRAGFDYSDKAIGNELSLNEEQTKKLDEWVRIVFICDILDLADGVERTEDDQQEGSVVFVAGRPGVAIAESSIGEHLEQKQFEPKTKVSMDNIEPLSEEQLKQLINDLQSSPADRLRDRLREKVAGLASKYMKNKALKVLNACWWPKEVVDSGIGTTAVSRDQQLCGKKATLGTMIFQIFIGGLIALTMALFSVME